MFTIVKKLSQFCKTLKPAGGNFPHSPQQMQELFQTQKLRFLIGMLLSNLLIFCLSHCSKPMPPPMVTERPGFTTLTLPLKNLAHLVDLNQPLSLFNSQKKRLVEKAYLISQKASEYSQQDVQAVVQVPLQSLELLRSQPLDQPLLAMPHHPHQSLKEFHEIIF